MPHVTDTSSSTGESWGWMLSIHVRNVPVRQCLALEDASTARLRPTPGRRAMSRKIAP